MEVLIMRNATIAILASLLISGPALAQVIDFESIPGQGIPIDNQLISNQFESGFGVTFVLLENDGTVADPSIGPRIAGVGGPKTAFVGPTRNPDCDQSGATTNDTPADLVRSGCWILTDDGVHPGPRPFGLRVVYSNPVLLAGGELLDVDGGPEGWQITALDENLLPIAHANNPVDIVFPGTPGTGDGLASVFSFDLEAPIHYIELIYTGEDSFGRGLAFDNFSPASLPTQTHAQTWGEVKVRYR
jgi:hypothetical protein